MNKGYRWVTVFLCIALSGCNPERITSPGSSPGINADESTGYDNLRVIVRDASISDSAAQPRDRISAGFNADEFSISTTQPLLQTEPTAFEQLESTTLEDGTVTVVLDDSFQSPLIATRECVATESLKSDALLPEESNRTGRKCVVSVRHQAPQKLQ